MAMTDTPERAARDGRGRWLQLGLLTATAVAPLIARWRRLREDDYAQALRERAEGLREQAAARATQAAQVARAMRQPFQRRRGEEFASPDIAAGPEVESIAEQLAPLAALVSVTSAAAPVSDGRRRAVRASLWLAGVSAGLIAAGVVTYIVIRKREKDREERETFNALSMDHFDSAPLTTPPVSPRPTPEPTPPPPTPTREPGFAPPLEFSDDDGDGAEWVGDIYTRAYTSVNALGGALPDNDRRIYFTSEEEAIAAGYHRAGVAPSERE